MSFYCEVKHIGSSFWMCLQLSETKIFTASSVVSMPMPQENVTITAGQRYVMI